MDKAVKFIGIAGSLASVAMLVLMIVEKVNAPAPPART